jgi:hypothetical protein
MNFCSVLPAFVQMRWATYWQHEWQNLFTYANSLMSGTLNNAFFLDVTPCILVDTYKVSEESTDPTFYA